jgi:hypothetical protein
MWAGDLSPKYLIQNYHCHVNFSHTFELVKNWKYLKLLSFLLVVYSTGATPVFANNQKGASTLIQEQGLSVDHSDSPALFIEEVSVIEIIDPSFENKLLSFGTGISNFTPGCTTSGVQRNFVNSFSLRDKRKLIATSIFPFHFFW